MQLRSGIALAFERHGVGGPLVLLLHGLSGSRLGYREVIEHLVTQPSCPLTVVAVDMRGHGQSSRAEVADYDAAGYAADIIEVIEGLGLGPAMIVGHSLGGVVAAAVAQRAPHLVRGLFLEDPPLFEGDDERRAASPVASLFPVMIKAVREIHSSGAPASAYEVFGVGLTGAALIERGITLSRWDPTTMEAAVDGTVWRTFEPTAQLPVPTTLLHADPQVGAVFSPDDVAPFMTANPHARVRMIAGAGHTIHSGATQPEYFAELDRWITDLTSSTSQQGTP